MATRGRQSSTGCSESKACNVGMFPLHCILRILGYEFRGGEGRYPSILKQTTCLQWWRKVLCCTRTYRYWPLVHLCCGVSTPYALSAYDIIPKLLCTLSPHKGQHRFDSTLKNADCTAAAVYVPAQQSRTTYCCTRYVLQAQQYERTSTSTTSMSTRETGLIRSIILLD